MTKKILIIAVIVTVCCTACRLVGVTVTYNMTGGSLDPAIKTFSVDYFPNKAPLVMPTLSTTFTEKLTEYIILCYNHYEKVTQTEKIRNGGYFYGDKKRLLSKRTYR